MPTAPDKVLIDLETRFWQALVAQDADAATGLLAEPALMVSAHGAMKFDHAAYRKMVDQGTTLITAYEFSDMQVTFPNPATAIITYHVKQTLKSRKAGDITVEEMNDSSTWVRAASDWKCVMHTESPVAQQMAHA